MDILIKNGILVTMDDENPVLPCGCIGITAGKITYVGDQPPREAAARVIDAKGKAVMPGLINAHTHVSMSLLRGYADDYPLHTWLHDHVFPAEARLDARCIRAGALLGMAEMLRTGTISISDMYMKIPAVAEAAAQTGIYANISNGATCFNREGYDFATDSVTREMEEMRLHWHGADGGRILLDASIHAEYTSFDRVWRDISRYAAQQGLRMQVHLSETRAEHEECIARYGKTPAQVLAEAGVFDCPTIAAHCVWVTEEDMELLARHGVTVAYNPVSNLKLGSGIAPAAKMLDKGINVALGTDGVCSNNSHDLFEEIKTGSLLQKGAQLNATLLPAWDALKMATVSGALAQGRQNELGRLRTGMDASLIMLDLNAPHLMPIHSIISTLAYSARGSDVCMTMVRGKILYENGQFPTLQLDQIQQELELYVMDQVFKA